METVKSYVFSILTGGRPFDSINCHVVAEGRFIIKNISFRTAVAAMFASYHVFDISYQEGCPASLEFIQRYTDYSLTSHLINNIII